MIRGMTGFGSARVSFGKIKGVLEVKSQNHRYFDIVYYLPIGFSSLEEKIRQRILKYVKRGRVTVSFKITEKPMHKLELNREAVNEYLSYARRLKKEYHLDNDLTLSDLIRLPGVVSTQETSLNIEKLWSLFQQN